MLHANNEVSDLTVRNSGLFESSLASISECTISHVATLVS